jgi:hypothetical protein
LWRAAFLADKTGKRAVVFNHGRIFFEKIIKDNAISYPQDKTSREWTFGLIAEIEMHEPGSRSSLFQLSGGLFP